MASEIQDSTISRQQGEKGTCPESKKKTNTKKESLVEIGKRVLLKWRKELYRHSSRGVGPARPSTAGVEQNESPQRGKRAGAYGGNNFWKRRETQTNDSHQKIRGA